MATKKKGRPSDYVPEVADDICALLSGGESLRSVCKRKGMPNTTKVMRWLREFPDFREQYAKAMESRADSVFEEIFEIADTAEEEPSAVAKARLRIDTRKWALARMNPRKYGDKVTNELVGKDGGAIQSESTVKVDEKALNSILGKL